MVNQRLLTKSLLCIYVASQVIDPVSGSAGFLGLSFAITRPIKPL